MEFQAKRWGELQAQLAGLRQKWTEAQALVAEAEAIEKDMARLGEVRTALPHVEMVFKQKQQAQKHKQPEQQAEALKLAVLARPPAVQPCMGRQ